jgi:lysozyme
LLSGPQNKYGMVYLVTPALVTFTASFEGVRLTAYQDGGGLWSIAYGSRYMVGGVPVKPGDTITVAQAHILLGVELQTAMHAVNTMVTAPLTQGQAEACADFCFNVGAGSFQHSTLLKLINAGNMTGAAGQFDLWVHDAHGVVESGLVRRATARKALFQS